MRKVEFEVPEEVFGDFAERLGETGLDNCVLGRNEGNEIEIEIHYEKEEAKVIDDLEDYLEELKNELDEEDPEENEDQGRDHRKHRK
jgi:hypothetical protein